MKQVRKDFLCILDAEKLLSLLSFFKDYLPFDYGKKMSEDDKEVLAFIRLFQKLGGDVLEEEKVITISETFETLLRLQLESKIVILIMNDKDEYMKHKQGKKQKIVVGASHYVLHSRKDLVSNLATVALSAKEITSKPRNLKLYSDEGGFNRNPKTKMKKGNKRIPKQNKRRR